MSIKIPADVRTAFRKILRDHPKVLDYVKTKSEVNNLSRDALIELADNLEINFLDELYNDKNVDLHSIMKFEENSSSLYSAVNNVDYDAPFSGELISDFKLTAFGTEQTLKIKVEYQCVPDWQFACLDDKRLKYRGCSDQMSLSVEVVDEEQDDPQEEVKSWLPIEECDQVWDLIRGSISDEIDAQVENIICEEDKINRVKLGFPSSSEY
jgi:hypothetical protein